MLVLSVLLLLREKYLLAYVPRVLLYYFGCGVYNIETDMNSDEIKDILANMTGILLILCTNSYSVVQLYRMIFVSLSYLLLPYFMCDIYCLCVSLQYYMYLMLKLNRHLI